MDEEEAVKILNDMVKLGFIESKGELYSITLKGLLMLDVLNRLRINKEMIQKN